MPLVTVETNNQTNNTCTPKVIQTNNASSRRKAANGLLSLDFRLIVSHNNE